METQLTHLLIAWNVGSINESGNIFFVVVHVFTTGLVSEFCFKLFFGRERCMYNYVYENETKEFIILLV